MPHQFSQDGVSYHAAMPVSWRPETNVSASAVEQWMHGNIILLHALATMEAVQSEKESDTAPAMAKTVERLEAKVDLALALIAKLLAQDTALPPARPVTLAAESMEWLAQDGPEPGADILISLYISPKLPQPLMLPASVASVLKEQEGMRIQVVFTHLSEEAQDWLARTVFRYHRRAIQNQHRAQDSKA
jgi:hypothetical protein